MRKRGIMTEFNTKEYEFLLTPYDTIRIFIKLEVKDGSDNEALHLFKKSRVGQMCESICLWGGADKREIGMISYEFPITLLEYFKDKFKHNPNANITGLGK